jgi:hypothetical protein
MKAKRPKPLNRAQRRKTELQKGVELLVRRERDEAFKRGVHEEHERVCVLLYPDEFGFVDLSRVLVNEDRYYVRVPAPVRSMLRMPSFDAPIPDRATYEFKAIPMEIRLPNGATAGWYNWEFVPARS